MISRRITVALDHGSSNSAIAVMTSTGPNVITYASKDQTMFPSCVFLFKNKRMLTGLSALNAAKTNFDEGDLQKMYKPCLGRNTLFPFVNAGIVKTAVELGTDVMGAMLEACRETTREQIHAAVVTHPAMFEQSRADATREAALATGLRYVSLLQEPVAAAMAYGFDAQTMKDQTWCVVDLGGGTLDVSLLMVRNGQITSPENCQLGDNHCGGEHWDKAVMMHIIRERLEKPPHNFKLSSFTMNKNSGAWFRLQLAVEQAKIELSEKDEAIIHVDGVLCKDDTGREVVVNERLKRSEYERLISPFVEKACTVVQDLLRKKELNKTQVSRLILVGGPTKTPYFRKRLQDSVGIPLDTSIDPMTAVVRGAALYAATQQIPTDVYQKLLGEEQHVGPAAIQLKIEAPGHSEAPMAPIQGQLVGVASPAGYGIEIVRRDGGWSSGRLPLAEDGYFEVDALLVVRDRPYCSEFEVKVFDPHGRITLEQDPVQIWHPFPNPRLSLPNPLLVELKDNRTGVLLMGGTKLPGDGQDTYATVKEIKAIPLADLLQGLTERVNAVFAFMQGKVNTSFADDTAKDLKTQLAGLKAKVHAAGRSGEDERMMREEIDAALAEVDRLEQKLAMQGLKVDPSKRLNLDVLRIHVLEGVPNAMGEVQEAADCNLKVGELVIPATMLKRNLPAGSDVVVALSMDASRSITVRAYLPILDEEFEARLPSIPDDDLTVEEAEKKLPEVERRLTAVKAVQKTHPLPAVEHGLKRIEQLDMINGIRKAIDMGKNGDGSSAERAIMETLSLQGTVEQLEQHQLLPRAQEDLKRLHELAAIFDPLADRELLADFDKRIASTPPGSALQALSAEIQGKDKSVRTDRSIEMIKRVGALLTALGDQTITLTSTQRTVYEAARDFWLERLDNDKFWDLDNAGFKKAWEWHKSMDGWFSQDTWHRMEDAFMSVLSEIGGGPDGPGGSGDGVRSPWKILITKK